MPQVPGVLIHRPWRRRLFVGEGGYEPHEGVRSRTPYVKSPALPLRLQGAVPLLLDIGLSDSSALAFSSRFCPPNHKPGHRQRAHLCRRKVGIDMPSPWGPPWRLVRAGTDAGSTVSARLFTRAAEQPCAPC